MNHTKKIFYRPHIIFQFVTESRLCIQVKFFEISLAVHFRWRQLSFGLRFWSVLFRWRLLSIWWSNFLSVHFWTVVDCSILNYQLLERLLRNRSLSRPFTFGRSLFSRPLVMLSVKIWLTEHDFSINSVGVFFGLSEIGIISARGWDQIKETKKLFRRSD